MTDPEFLLDASICVYLLGGESDAARDRVQRTRPGQLATSAVAFAEVLIGAQRRDALAEALTFFEVMTILPFDEQAGRTYSSLPLKRGSFDRLIAAHALARGLTLVTNNERDFADVPGLKVENWTV